ncbi:dienelactone hydrolase family protein [Hyphococcus flavus]|uniref:Dienelactone hydrolase family protein n=1 Tax=Hyphococcus flavus TaxID=1866326 RepID=A0AAF0CG22_9PROT|nr:dienelactone hydrolase family protein [Hyphococcus flavus]WDI31708.1 dienelactone hydrolase family protein [Hyphococcus flavus]
MSITTRTFDYEIEGKTYEGFLAAPSETPAPVVLVSHAWAGRSDFENGKAKVLAELGYTGIAIDLFGKGVLGTSKEENQELIEPFVSDRAYLQKHLTANIDMVKDQPEADASKVAAIGFCFGGLCVLDIARTGADVAGVVSFHGLLGASGNTVDKIKAKILALHGWDDPMAPPSDVVALGEELTKANADWQLHGYGGVMHAFTNPAANDPDFGTVYDTSADRRSWEAMKNFLSEIFA